MTRTGAGGVLLRLAILVAVLALVTWGGASHP
jgi:hypothetical protein